MNKEHILKKNIEFQRIIKSTKPYKYKDYIIYLEKTTDENYFFGFSVGKKIGNAVTRNHIKRQLKHILSKKRWYFGFNCIIIVGRNILNKNFSEKERELCEALKKFNIIKGENQ